MVQLSAFPSELSNACNLFGSLLVAFLVQYNRTGSLVLLIPVPLGLSMLALSCIIRWLKKKRCAFPSKRSMLLYLPAISCLLTACSLATVGSTSTNYPYVHSGWHALISIALSFLVLKCNGPGRRIQSVVALLEQNDSSACTSRNEDNVSEAPSNNTSERSTTFLAMPQISNSTKNLSYMQNFRALMSRQE